MSRLTTNIYFPAPSVKILLEGDWQKVTAATSGIGPAIQRGYDKAVSQFAKKLLQILKRAIQESAPPMGGIWEPQSESTIRTYKSHGWTVGMPYMRTGLFYRSIQLQGYGKRIYVGLPSNIRTREGLTLVQLARLLETGNEKIPARPLWAPALEAAGGRSEIKKQVIKRIRQELAGLGFKPNQVKL